MITVGTFILQVPKLHNYLYFNILLDIQLDLLLVPGMLDIY